MKNLVARSDAEREIKKRIQTNSTLLKKLTSLSRPSETDAKYIQYLYDGDKKKLLL